MDKNNMLYIQSPTVLKYFQKIILQILLDEVHTAWTDKINIVIRYFFFFFLTKIQSVFIFIIKSNKRLTILTIYYIDHDWCQIDGIKIDLKIFNSTFLVRPTPAV